MQHYVDNFRSLPWRAPPGAPAPDPYRVWLSEVMLQQTTVAAVIPRFERFVRRWPTIELLAAAPDEEVLGEWAGLGYYARARNLIACARMVAARGGFPRTEAELRELPGIGGYTAAAIAAIAFGEAVSAVDTNVERVVARSHGIAEPAASARREIRRIAASMVPPDRPGDFAQAMMDLGATICTPRRPRCDICPLQEDCAAFASGDPEAFPQPKQAAQRPIRNGIAWWTERDGRLWLVRRPSSGLLGGMASLPGPDWSPGPAPERRDSIRVRHVFTHFVLELDIVERGEPTGEGWWQALEEIDTAGLPTLYRRAVELMLARRPRRFAA